MNRTLTITFILLLAFSLVKAIAGLIADPIGELAGLGLYTLISVGFYALLSTRKS